MRCRRGSSLRRISMLSGLLCRDNDTIMDVIVPLTCVECGHSSLVFLQPRRPHEALAHVGSQSRRIPRVNRGLSGEMGTLTAYDARGTAGGVQRLHVRACVRACMRACVRVQARATVACAAIRVCRHIFFYTNLTCILFYWLRLYVPFLYKVSLQKYLVHIPLWNMWNLDTNRKQCNTDQII